jgi:formylmethanofuran dehydrogenase subunit E
MFQEPVIQDLWEKAVGFHGHACPGLAIGFMAVLAVREQPDLQNLPYGQLVCLTENDACGVDAIQVLLGCSLGKGNLIFKDTGKHAYNFYDRKSGQALRLVAKAKRNDLDKSKELSREERLEQILATPLKDLFEYKAPTHQLPEKEKIFQSVICDVCGEAAAEPRIRLKEGQKVCLDCYREYEKRW